MRRVIPGLVLVLVLVGCGSKTPDDPGAPFRVVATAQASGDAKLACSQYSRGYLRRIERAADRPGRGRALCEQALRAAGKQAEPRARVTKVVRHGDRADVTYVVSVAGVTQTRSGRAVREDGTWKVDAASRAISGTGEIYRVPSEAMQPTLKVGTLVAAVPYGGARPQLGDIVVFRPPRGSQTQKCGRRPRTGQACAVPTPATADVKFLKRIVGLPGDSIAMRAGHLIRNGRRVREAFAAPCGAGAGCDFPRALIVPPGMYYVLGDNRGQSDDSRFWGAVPLSSIIGRVRR